MTDITRVRDRARGRRSCRPGGARAALGALLLLLLGSPVLGTPEAGAQPAGGPPPAGSGTAGEGGEAPEVKVERGAGGKKVYRITTSFVIEGRIQKPNAFYVLQRSQINYDWAALKQDFVPRIVDSVRRSPF